MTNVYAKFRNFPLRINKALGIFRIGVTTTTRRRRTRRRTTVVALRDPSGSKKLKGQLDEVDRVGHQLPWIDRLAQLDRFRCLEKILYLECLQEQATIEIAERRSKGVFSSSVAKTPAA